MAETKIVIKATDATKKAFSSVNKGLGKMRAGVNSTYVKVGLLAGVAGFGALVRSSSKTADALAKTADKIGVSTEALAGLQNAAEITGVSQETLNKALVKQQVAIADYSNGIGLAKREFEQLGFAQNELAGLSADEQFIRISEALGKVSNSTDRVNIAYKIYGGRATDLLNTLDLGADGLRRFREESDAFGTSLSRVDAAKIEASNDAFTRIGQAFKGFGLQITAKLAPLLEAVANSFVKIAKESGGMGKVSASAFDSMITGAGFFADTLRGIEVSIKIVEIAFAGVAVGIIGALSAINDAVRPMINGWIMLQNLIGGTTIPIIGSLGGTFDAATKRVSALTNELDVLVKKEMPSDKFKKYSAEIQAEATAMAEKVAATKAAAGGGSDVGTVQIDQAAAEKDQQRLADKFARLDESLLSEKERLQLAFEDKQFIVEEAFQNELIGNEERNTTLQQLELQHQNQLTKLSNRGLTDRQKFERMTTLAQTRFVLGNLTNLLSQSAQYSKTFFKLNKVAGIANAIVNTAEGVTKSLSAYPFPINVGMAAATAAAGLAQIKTIRSQSFGGGGSIPAPVQTTPVSSLPDQLANGGNQTAPGSSELLNQQNAQATQNQSVTLNLGDEDEMISVSAMRRFLERAQQVAEDMGPNTKIVIA